MKFSGCSVHFVDEGLDSGPIVKQAVVDVLDGDTAESLSARILVEEHRIYSEALASLDLRDWELSSIALLPLSGSSMPKI